MILTFGTIHDGTRYRIKDREKAIIFQDICANGTATRKSIAEKYNFRPTSVSLAVQEMLDDNLTKEGKIKKPGKPGRPELILKPNYNLLTAISIYTEGRELKGALINLGEQIITERSVFVHGDTDNNRFKEQLTDLIDSLSASVPEDSVLIGAVISLVGTVNPSGKLWISSARWNKIQNLDFNIIQASRNLPVSIRRSLDAELEYQIIKNKELALKNVILFHWGFGIGAAYSCCGKILGSTIGRFGEIGHTQAGSTGKKKCLCGSYGCLETESAIWALLPRLEQQRPEAAEDERMFIGLLNRPDIKNSEIIESATHFTGIGLTNLYKILYPDVIIFIGPFTENKKIFSNLIRYFEDELPDYARRAVSYRVVTDGFRGAITGNVYLLFRKNLQKLLKARY